MKGFHYYRRKWTNRFVATFCVVSSLAGVTVLSLVLGYVIYKGSASINWNFFTQLPVPPGETGGGMANAILGTLTLISLASIIGIPFGIATGLYLAEYGNHHYGSLVRYLTDVLNGFPSVVMGLFAYALLVIPMGHFSGISGGFALSLLMIPMIVRTTEEVVRLVPHSLREGALALGIPYWKVLIKIVLSTAKGGILTAVILSMARIAGETAPLIFTAFGNQFWQTDIFQPMAALTLQIYTYATGPYEEWHAQAWAGSLVLVGMSLLINLGARLLTSRK